MANDKALGGGLAAGLQQVGIGASPLTYFDGPAARNVLTDIASGGGINTSADHRTLYVSETAGKRIRVLDRDDAGDVAERMRVAMDTSPDNIDVAADGSLWVTGHANTLALIRHFISGSPAPTQVWRVALGPEKADSIEEIYLDDGTQMSAGSVGATWQQPAPHRLHHGAEDPDLRAPDEQRRGREWRRSAAGRVARWTRRRRASPGAPSASSPAASSSRRSTRRRRRR